MPSFDIVSELKKDELQNAVDNANRELQSRYDFRGVEACNRWCSKRVSIRSWARRSSS